MRTALLNRYCRLLGLTVLMAIGTKPAHAIDIETAVEYYNNKQYVPAFLDFQILAAEGDPVAMAYMGRMYRRGDAVEKNLEEAERWLKAGAEGGVPMAHHRLGWMYARGEIGGVRDNVLAVKHWKSAAEGGLPRAQMDLGVMYWIGQGTPKNMVLARTWMLLATEDPSLRAAASNLKRLSAEMSEEQIAEAQALAAMLSEEIRSTL